MGALCFDVYSERAIKGGAHWNNSGYIYFFIFLLSRGEPHVFLSDLESDKDTALLRASVIICSDWSSEMCAVTVLSAWPDKTFADKCLNYNYRHSVL